MLDCIEGVTLGRARGDEGLADLGIQPYLGVERFAVGRETLLVLAFVAREKGPDEPVVQLKDLVGECGGGIQCNGRQRGMPAQWFMVLELVHGRLRAFTGHAQQAIGIHVTAQVRGQADIA